MIEGNVWEARVARDLLGLEIERQLPGGVRARWQRDAIGRPTQQEITAAGEFRRAVHYTWEVNDRLRMVVDAARGPVRYEHDALGNLAAATYEDGRVDLRMPDAVGNLFRTQSRTDRKYGPAGQLLESREPDGRVVTYDYDPEGNLVKKTEVDAAPQLARVWTYQWNTAGMLTKVVRPDGETVTFTYDALARRLSKTYRARTTKWIWDGNLPLHEWVEGRPAAISPTHHGALGEVAVLDELAARRRRYERAAKPSQGPPDDSFAAPQPTTPAVPVWSTGATEPGTAEDPITWLFDPESFAPMAKLVGDARYAIVTDHLGTPTAMYDAAGAEVWSATIDAYGDLRNITGTRSACPFRWPGQYEDAETGLCYNRFRYYDPASGEYTRQDPIRLAGGRAIYGYPGDPTVWLDPLGLTGCTTAAEQLPEMKGMSVGEAEELLVGHGFTRTNPANPKNQRWVHTDGSEVQIHAYGNATAGPYKSGNNAHVHKDIGRHGQPGTISLSDRGLPSTDAAVTHIGIANPADFPTVAGRPHGT
jgi:RHS repeat-associated protein